MFPLNVLQNFKRFGAHMQNNHKKNTIPSAGMRYLGPLRRPAAAAVPRRHSPGMDFGAGAAGPAPARGGIPRPGTLEAVQDRLIFAGRAQPVPSRTGGPGGHRCGGPPLRARSA